MYDHTWTNPVIYRNKSINEDYMYLRVFGHVKSWQRINSLYEVIEHRDDGPAAIKWYPNDKQTCKTFKWIHEGCETAYLNVKR